MSFILLINRLINSNLASTGSSLDRILNDGLVIHYILCTPMLDLKTMIITVQKNAQKDVEKNVQKVYGKCIGNAERRMIVKYVLCQNFKFQFFTILICYEDILH